MRLIHVTCPLEVLQKREKERKNRYVGVGGHLFHAEYLGMLHQYQFFIDEEQAKKLLVYHYEWNKEIHMLMQHLVM